MSKYYEVVDISQKPDKEGWYDLIDPEGDYHAETRYFKKDYFFESEEHATNGNIDEDDDIKGLFWLRPLDHPPLSREQADPSVLLEALEEISKIEDKDTDFKEDPLLSIANALRECTTIATKALTTYKESKPSQSISREQAEKVWDVAQQSTYDNAHWDKDSQSMELDYSMVEKEKEEFLKQFK